MSESRILEATLEIVREAVAKGGVKAHEIPDLIDSVAAALSRIQDQQVGQARRPTDTPGAAGQPPLMSSRPPAVPVEESIMPDGKALICLEDGMPFQMLKRHLRMAHNLSPKQYRERWGLPADYPMSAPAYAERKRAEAAAVGLGTVENRAGKRAPAD